MTARRSGATKRSRTLFLVAAILALVIAMVMIGFGSASLASLSGELPVDDPTPQEVRVWETGWALLWGALASTIVAGAAVAFAASTFTRGQVALSITGFISCVVLVALVAIGVWFVALPD